VAFPLPHLNPIDQAILFYERSDTLGSQAGELPPALDIEWPPREHPGQKLGSEWRRWGCTGGQILAWTLACATHMEHLWKRTPVVYTYPWFWKSVIEAPDVEPEHLAAMSRFIPWIAGGPHYQDAKVEWIPTKKDVAKHLPSLKPWEKKGPWVWQHDGTGGIRVGHADVDANVTERATFELLQVPTVM
jgi:hypothetical protein